MADNVNHPSHYADGCSMECIETMRIAFGAEHLYIYCACNAYKYMWRYKSKNGMEDLKKAKWYLDYAQRLIENGAAKGSEFPNLSDMFDIWNDMWDSLVQTEAIKNLPKK